MSASLPFTVMPCPCCGSMKIAISTTTNALTNLPRNDRPVCLECGVRAETLEAWNKRTARPEALRSGEMPSDACRAALANIMARIDGDEFVPTEYKEDARAALAGKRAPFTSDDVIPTIVDWRGLIASKEGGSRVTLVDAIGIGDQLVSALIEETGRRKRAEILLQAMNGHYVRSPLAQKQEKP